MQEEPNVGEKNGKLKIFLIICIIILLGLNAFLAYLYMTNTKEIKDKKKQNRIFSKYTATHLDLAVDAVKNMEAKWDEVKRRLTSEW